MKSRQLKRVRKQPGVVKKIDFRFLRGCRGAIETTCGASRDPLWAAWLVLALGPRYRWLATRLGFRLRARISVSHVSYWIARRDRCARTRDRLDSPGLALRLGFRCTDVWLFCGTPDVF